MLLINNVFNISQKLTVEPRSTDTRFIQTVSFVPTKSSYIFCKINPLNTDNGHFSVSGVTNGQPRFTDSGYLHTVYFHCNNYVINVNIVGCSNNDRFLCVNIILLQNYH